jgi:hypothetical protein
MTGIFGILKSSAMQSYQDVAPTQEYFFIVTSIVYGSGTLEAIFFPMQTIVRCWLVRHGKPVFCVFVLC